MNISSKAEYGIRAVVEIASHAQPVKRTSIAERQGIPVPFLTQVLRALVNSGLVRSSRGPDGGYTLGRPAAHITLLEVVTTLQGPVMPKGCVDVESAESCVIGGDSCLLRDVWSELKAANERVLADITVKDLSSKEPGS